MTHRQSAAQRHPFDTLRQKPGVRRGGDFLRIDEFARADQLGDDHCDGFQRLDFVFVVIAALAILNNQDAADATAADQGNAAQRLIGVFTGFRPVGEVGMAGRIRERKRPSVGGDFTHNTFADPQPRLVHRLWIEADSRKKLEHLARAHQVAGTDLGDHFGCDQADDLVQPLLCRAGAGHEIAQPRQQAARTVGAGRRRISPSSHRCLAARANSTIVRGAAHIRHDPQRICAPGILTFAPRGGDPAPLPPERSVRPESRRRAARS